MRRSERKAGGLLRQLIQEAVAGDGKCWENELPIIVTSRKYEALTLLEFLFYHLISQVSYGNKLGDIAIMQFKIPMRLYK